MMFIKYCGRCSVLCAGLWQWLAVLKACSLHAAPLDDCWRQTRRESWMLRGSENCRCGICVPWRLR